jgi:hypothetical protein
MRSASASPLCLISAATLSGSQPQHCATGRVDQYEVGWYRVNIDAYFLELADLIADVLETEKAIKQLKAALWLIQSRRATARRHRAWERRRARMRAQEARDTAA